MTPGPTVGALLAHPLTEADGLPVSPLAAGVLAACAVALVGLYAPAPRSRAGSDERFESWAGPLSRRAVLGRTAAAALLLLAVAAGRLGSPDELENLAPALIVGLAWPGLLFVSAAGGPLWRWLDPWDGGARLLGRHDPADAPGPGVLPAVGPAVLWTWYLGVYPEPLDPRAIGTALAAYSIFTIGGALAVGRRRWFSSVEPFGILFGWLARLSRGALGGWEPPRGAEVLLGALAGGLLFGAIRRTDLWGGLNVVPAATLWATIGLLLSAAVGAAVLRGLRFRAREHGAAVVIAALPAVAAIGVALGMSRSRLFTSIQLLPGLLSDPFGAGWDPFGWSGLRINVPLEPATLFTVQLAVLLAGAAAGAVAASAGHARRTPGMLSAAIVCGAGTVAVALAPGLS